jgi:hypothetical protein
MASPLARAAGFVSPFTTTSVPSPLMVAYAAVYLLVALTLAMWGFRRRDL